MSSQLVKSVTKRRFSLVLVTLASITLTVMRTFDIGSVFEDLGLVQPSSTHIQRQLTLRCSLEQMLEGHWTVGNYTSQELEELEMFIRHTREYHTLPATLQRDDKKCGNLNFPNHQWHRAVCNPIGATSCCKNNVCVNETVQECACNECYDMRQSIHAEFAVWTPDNASCKLQQFKTEEDVCRVLQNKTVYFIGDSFMRQLYTSMLAVLRDKKPRHVLRDDIREGTQTVIESSDPMAPSDMDGRPSTWYTKNTTGKSTADPSRAFV